MAEADIPHWVDGLSLSKAESLATCEEDASSPCSVPRHPLTLQVSVHRASLREMQVL